MNSSLFLGCYGGRKKLQSISKIQLRFQFPQLKHQAMVKLSEIKIF